MDTLLSPIYGNRHDADEMEIEVLSNQNAYASIVTVILRKIVSYKLFYRYRMKIN
jgi:hypothetical protein